MVGSRFSGCGSCVVKMLLLMLTMNGDATAYKDILPHFTFKRLLSTLWQQLDEEPFLFQHDEVPEHKSSSIKARFDEFGVEELEYAA